MRVPMLVSLVSLALAAACGAGTNPGDGSMDGGTSNPGGTSVATQAADSTATSAGVELPDGCSCREVDEDAPRTCEGLARTECEGQPICDELVGMCSRPNPDMYACDPEYYAYDEEVLTCLIEALRDRTPGKLAIDDQNDTCGLEGCGSDRLEITIVPGDRAVVRYCYSSPLSAEESSTSIAGLAEPAHFEGCLALAIQGQRYQCMRDGLVAGAELCG